MRVKFNTLEKYRHFKKNEYGEPNEIIFKIESECRMRPTYLFFKALVILIAKLEIFISNLETNHDSVNITQLGNIDNFYQISIKNEDHTLLNTLQCMIYKEYFQKPQNSINKLEYIGYLQPHPLDNLMYIKLKFSADNKIDAEFIKIFMINAVRNIIEYIHIIIKEWILFNNLNKVGIIEINKYI